MKSDLNRRMTEKQETIIALWTEAYDKIFDDYRLKGRSSEKLLELLKVEALAHQIDNVVENWHLYAPKTLKEIQTSIDNAVIEDGYSMALDLVESFMNDIHGDSHA